MATFTVYEGSDKKWYWRLKADNGRVIADSGEGYASEYNVVRAAKRCKELAPTAPIKRSDGTVLSEAKLAEHVDPF